MINIAAVNALVKYANNVRKDQPEKKINKCTYYFYLATEAPYHVCLTLDLYMSHGYAYHIMRIGYIFYCLQIRVTCISLA